MNEFLSPTFYIDSDSEDIQKAVEECTSGKEDEIEKAVAIYYRVRDGIKYNPYLISPDKNQFIASETLKRGVGYCVQKAILFAAMSRFAGIPCALGFANVKNHLTTVKLRELMGSDLFVFHGYNSIFLGGKWIKATPTFDIKLCEKFGVIPLDFDGHSDAVFHEYNKFGSRHMEYIHDYGTFADFPFDMMMSESAKYYPDLVKNFLGGRLALNGSFIDEEKAE